MRDVFCLAKNNVFWGGIENDSQVTDDRKKKACVHQLLTVLS